MLTDAKFATTCRGKLGLAKLAYTHRKDDCRCSRLFLRYLELIR